jgi:hypothetical protein
MVKITLRLDNPEQARQIQHHLSTRVSDWRVQSSNFDALGGDHHTDGHHFEIEYHGGDPERFKEAFHHTMLEMGHPADWEHRFQARKF